MSENNYDDFAEKWTTHMRTGKNIVHDYVAKPALYKQIGDVKGKTILCIGCGSGEECEYLKSIGAKKVVGIDTSQELINIAKQSFPDLEFHVMDMEKMSFPPESFDMVVSSLTIHYVPNWKKTLDEIRKIIKPDGKVIITTNHPIRFGAEIRREKTREIFLMGYIRYKDPKAFGEVIGDYLGERKVEDVWLRNKLPVTYYHRPISAIFKDIKEGNFEITDFVEYAPEKWVQEENPSFYNIHTKIPLFMLFELKKK